MNPYEPPRADFTPPTSAQRGPSRGFWIAIAGVIAGLIFVLALPLVQKIKQDKLKREALENIRQLSEAIKKFEHREAAK